MSRARKLKGLHFVAFDQAAVHANADVLEFYKNANAPPATTVYTRSKDVANDELTPYTTFRYVLRNFTVPTTVQNRRGKSAPATPVSSDNEEEEDGEKTPLEKKLRAARQRLQEPQGSPSPRKRAKISLPNPRTAGTAVAAAVAAVASNVPVQNRNKRKRDTQPHDMDNVLEARNAAAQERGMVRDRAM